MIKENVRYQRELQKTYLIVSDCEKELLENYAGKMVMSGIVNGLIKCHKYRLDGEWEIWYDISSLQSLEQVYAVKELDYSELKKLFYGLMLVLQELERCLLDNKQLSFEAKNLYLDMEKNRLLFVYDFSEKKEQSSLCRLAEYLLEKTCHEDEKAVELAYFFYEQVQRENFCIRELEHFLGTVEEKPEIPCKEQPKTEKLADSEEEIKFAREANTIENKKMQERDFRRHFWKNIEWESRSGKLLEGGIACACMVLFLGIGYLIVQRYFTLNKRETIIWLGISGILFVTGICLAIFSILEKRRLRDKTEYEKESAQSILPSEMGQLFSEDELYCHTTEENCMEESDGKTVYVGNALQNRKYCLVENTRGEEKRYPVERYPFLIGKEKSCVNMMIKDMSVSRIHARLIEEEDGIYMEDLHSTNGTYLNDMLLEPHKKVRLKKGDILQFGKREFRLC